MSGRVAKAIRRQMGTTGIDPASRLWINQYRYLKRLYNNPNTPSGGGIGYGR